MNAYIVDAGDREGGRTEQPQRLVDIVIASTRNRARYLFWLAHKADLGDLTDGWCKHLLLVKKFVTRPGGEGLLEDSDPGYEELWKKSEDVLE